MKNRTYIGEFSEWKDVRSNFGGDCPAKEPRYVFAGYDTPSYEGYSTVILASNGRAFEIVEGSHCSCYGLEGQWQATKHTVTDLRKMLGASYGFFHDNKAAIEQWLKHIRPLP